MDNPPGRLCQSGFIWGLDPGRIALALEFLLMIRSCLIMTLVGTILATPFHRPEKVAYVGLIILSILFQQVHSQDRFPQLDVTGLLCYHARLGDMVRLRWNE
jgi:hypothetical protein